MTELLGTVLGIILTVLVVIIGIAPTFLAGVAYSHNVEWWPAIAVVAVVWFFMFGDWSQNKLESWGFVSEDDDEDF